MIRADNGIERKVAEMSQTDRGGGNRLYFLRALMLRAVAVVRSQNRLDKYHEIVESTPDEGKL